LAAKLEGAGLGLLISREIVHSLGGSLTVQSVSGQGSCFRVILPLTVPTSKPALEPYEPCLRRAPGPRSLNAGQL